jgi:hypothetical protein
MYVNDQLYATGMTYWACRSCTTYAMCMNHRLKQIEESVEKVTRAVESNTAEAEKEERYLLWNTGATAGKCHIQGENRMGQGQQTQYSVSLEPEDCEDLRGRSSSTSTSDRVLHGDRKAKPSECLEILKKLNIAM